MKNWILFILTALGVFLLAMLAYSIMDRKAEARFSYRPLVVIGDFEPRDSIWGLNFPRQYQSYMRTKDTSYSSYFNTSGFRDALLDMPEMVILWAGYPFSKDYNHPRGHAYAVTDVHRTLRIGAPMNPGDGVMNATCWTCKSSDVPRLMNEMGLEKYYGKKLSELGSEVINPIGCVDCHDPKTMALSITRPALLEALNAMGKDIRNISHQEMRSLVCAQCHVEYYFDKNRPGQEGTPFVTFPWKNGMGVEEIEKYFDQIQFNDWIHPLSKAPMLKAQHPDYELYMSGVHAKRGISCADCHMPYRTEGGQKFTDHHLRSPLANIENSCFVCHREKTEDLMTDVFERQKKIKEGANRLMRLLAMAHIEAAKAWELGASNEQMKDILMGIRHAQWRWDYAVASHGGSFHAPLETSRIITTGIDKIQDTRIALARLLASLGYNKPVEMPDFSSKSALQRYIGLDIDEERKAKEKFLKEVIPQWIESGKIREKNMEVRTINSNE